MAQGRRKPNLEFPNKGLLTGAPPLDFWGRWEVLHPKMTQESPKMAQDGHELGPRVQKHLGRASSAQARRKVQRKLVLISLSGHRFFTTTLIYIYMFKKTISENKYGMITYHSVIVRYSENCI